ncbi:pyridine nucleotide-disulfide oxidoreductase [Prauserella coralliicola]|nr:pyridine nucleotide-disulfide oxidoreductase [Prauserella coralliicola]
MTDVLEADVLVLGGGPAGAWAALSAAEAGASVVLADKGYCGTSGATASGGNNLWHIPPGPRRDEAILDRQAKGGQLTDAGWMEHVLDMTYRRVGQLADWGYPFPEEGGVQRRSSLQGPEYMRRMRRKVHRAGVRILDHHPALELLADRDGAVSGAAGIARQRELGAWRVHARAVVIATGGCAFLSGGFGTNVDTGDGLLMAAEAGAELSGMEFSTAYALSAEWGVHTKGLMLQFASFYDEKGRLVDLPPGVPPRQGAALLLARGHRVFARLDRAPHHLRAAMRQAQPNYFLPLEKAGIDVFTQAYPLRMVYEGTVRGSGGLRVVTTDCATTVPGLFAAGDAATRELITGAISGGGSHNGAWAISSGTFAGRGAASFARLRGALPRDLEPLGRAGLRPEGPATLAPGEVVGAAQEHILPPRKSYLRTGLALRASRASLAGLWRDAAAGLSGTGRDRLRAREAASLVAHARWITAAALARAESRGMHRRTDLPERSAALNHRILTGGLDEVWTRPDPVPPVLLAARTEERAS